MYKDMMNKIIKQIRLVYVDIWVGILLGECINTHQAYMAIFWLGCIILNAYVRVKEGEQ